MAYKHDIHLEMKHRTENDGKLQQLVEVVNLLSTVVFANHSRYSQKLRPPPPDDPPSFDSLFALHSCHFTRSCIQSNRPIAELLESINRRISRITYRITPDPSSEAMLHHIRQGSLCTAYGPTCPSLHNSRKQPRLAVVTSR